MQLPPPIQTNQNQKTHLLSPAFRSTSKKRRLEKWRPYSALLASAPKTQLGGMGVVRAGMLASRLHGVLGKLHDDFGQISYT